MYAAILWRGSTVNIVVAEGGDEQCVSGMCAVAYAGHEVIPVILTEGADHFGWWPSTVSTDPLTAWRTAQLLAKVKRLRSHGTLGELVDCLQAENGPEWSKDLCEDFGFSAEELARVLEAARQSLPAPEELETMFRALVGKVEDWNDPYTQYLEPLMKLEAEGMRVTDWMASLLKEVRDLKEKERMREEAEQCEIDRPVPPEESAGQLLRDFGVTGFGNPLTEEPLVDAAMFDYMLKEIAFGRYTSSPRVVMARGKQREGVLFMNDQGSMEVRINGRRVIIHRIGYVPDEDVYAGCFALDTTVMGRKTKRGHLSVVQFRKTIEELRRLPFLKHETSWWRWRSWFGQRHS